MGLAMRIGEVAEAAGVSTKALRFYEREGLLAPPPRTSNGYRDHPPDVVERVRFIKDAQASGLTLAQVREVLDLRDAGEAPCGHVAASVRERLEEVEARLRDLASVRDQLLAISEHARRLDPDDCDGFCGLIPPRDDDSIGRHGG